VRYRLEVRLAAGDVGRRVVIRWRRPAGKNGEETADVLGVLEAADAVSFRVRKASGELVTIPRDRALAGKTVPAVPRCQHRGPGSPDAGGVTPGRSG
jgi:N-acetylglutamate synthase